MAAVHSDSPFGEAEDVNAAVPPPIAFLPGLEERNAPERWCGYPLKPTISTPTRWPPHFGLRWETKVVDSSSQLSSAGAPFRCETHCSLVINRLASMARRCGISPRLPVTHRPCRSSSSYRDLELMAPAMSWRQVVIGGSIIDHLDRIFFINPYRRRLHKAAQLIPATLNWRQSAAFRRLRLGARTVLHLSTRGQGSLRLLHLRLILPFVVELGRTIKSRQKSACPGWKMRR